jgi:hypothetical protein
VVFACVVFELLLPITEIRTKKEKKRTQKIPCVVLFGELAQMHVGLSFVDIFFLPLPTATASCQHCHPSHGLLAADATWI